MELPIGPDARCCLLPDISAVSLSRVETLRVVCCSLFQMFEMTFLVFPPPSLLSPPSPSPLAQTRPHWPIRGCLWVLVSIKKKAGSSFKKKRKKLMYSFLDNGIAVRIQWTFFSAKRQDYLGHKSSSKHAPLPFGRSFKSKFLTPLNWRCNCCTASLSRLSFIPLTMALFNN